MCLTWTVANRSSTEANLDDGLLALTIGAGMQALQEAPLLAQGRLRCAGYGHLL